VFKKYLIAIFLLCWLVLAINPVDRGIWMLENVLVVTVFPVVLWLDKRYVFNNLTFLSLTLFVILHLFGANMTYNAMTYFNWFSDWLGFQRNYYDQVIHFLFGLMVFTSFFEIFYHQGQSRKLSYLIALLFITAIGSWYEILEWLAMALFCPGTELECFDGVTQGDLWDTQKDMAFAVIGASITMLMHSMWGKRRQSEMMFR
jgi:putative membrane protein